MRDAAPTLWPIVRRTENGVEWLKDEEIASAEGRCRCLYGIVYRK